MTKNISCKCGSLPALADVAMGEHKEIFASLEERKWFGNEAWWLTFRRCRVCDQPWLIAQDERTNDVFLMRRMSADEVRAVEDGNWPSDFRRYEDVLRLGRARGHNWTCIDRLSPDLIATINDLVRERSTVTIEELAYLLNVDADHAEELAVQAEQQYGCKVLRSGTGTRH